MIQVVSAFPLITPRWLPSAVSVHRLLSIEKYPSWTCAAWAFSPLTGKAFGVGMLGETLILLPKIRAYSPLIWLSSSSVTSGTCPRVDKEERKNLDADWAETLLLS